MMRPKENIYSAQGKSSSDTRQFWPDAAADEFRKICSLITVIAQRIRTLTPSVDPSDVRAEIEDLLDRSIVPTGLHNGGQPVAMKRVR